MLYLSSKSVKNNRIYYFFNNFLRVLDSVMTFKVSKNKNGLDSYSTILINVITYHNNL